MDRYVSMNDRTSHMAGRTRWKSLALGLLGLLCSFSALSAEKSIQGNFVRIAPDGHSLDTAITAYRRIDDGRPIYLDLVSVVHIAEPDYFEQLNEQFKHYDYVFYELVGDPEWAFSLEADDYEKSFVSELQLDFADELGLGFQFDYVDYDAENFVHADMRAWEFERLMDRSMESPMALVGDLLKTELAALTQPSPLDPILLLRAALSDADKRQALLREVGAQVLSSMTTEQVPFESLIIEKRNIVALKRMEQALDNIGTAKGLRCALFYGAAHMPDFHQRLVQRHRFKPRGKTRWLPAWSLSE